MNEKNSTVLNYTKIRTSQKRFLVKLDFFQNIISSHKATLPIQVIIKNCHNERKCF